MSNAIGRTKRTLVVVSLVALAFTAATAQAEILNFQPEPGSPNHYEFIWSGSALTEGPGAHGSGNIATAPGLRMNVPYLIPGIPEGTVGTSGTIFRDATLDILTALPQDGLAIPAFGFVVQPLGTGNFELFSNDPAGGDPPVLLLAGTVNSASISGTLGDTGGIVLSADVTYTGGAVADAAGGAPFNGGFSWTLLEMDTPLAISGTTGMLEAFSAHATGSFTPEPATMALLGIGGVLMAVRRRRQRGV